MEKKNPYLTKSKFLCSTALLYPCHWGSLVTSDIETQCPHFQYSGHGAAQREWHPLSWAVHSLDNCTPQPLWDLLLGLLSRHWPFLLGLDPVEASFEGTPEEVRLDPSDADFVDVIHTDAASLIPFLGESCHVPAISTCNCVLTRKSQHQEKLIAVLNISGFGTSQQLGHLDFFPNGGEEMPGCKKNALSQIVDLDGIWSGKARAEQGASLPWGNKS